MTTSSPWKSALGTRLGKWLRYALLNFFVFARWRNFSLKEKKKRFCGKFGSIPPDVLKRKGKKCFCDEPASVWPPVITLHRIFIFFFDFARIFSLFSLVFRTSKLLEFKEFYKTVIPFRLVGCETGYSQFGATRLGGYLPSHIQQALIE